MNKANSAVTLIELLVALSLVSVMVLSFYGLDTFSRKQVFSSDVKAKVQNELSYALEHMSKYVQQGIGNNSDTINQAIQQTGYGFKVRVDFNPAKTPSNLSDDACVYYSLSDNALNTSCGSCLPSMPGNGTCGSFISETLSNRIIAGFAADTIIPVNPAKGFYVKVDSLGSLVDVGLVARYKPTEAVTPDTKSRNPQVEMKTKIICSNCSSN